jgi:hypothetical protein
MFIHAYFFIENILLSHRKSIYVVPMYVHSKNGQTFRKERIKKATTLYPGGIWSHDP